MQFCQLSIILLHDCKDLHDYVCKICMNLHDYVRIIALDIINSLVCFYSLCLILGLPYM